MPNIIKKIIAYLFISSFIITVVLSFIRPLIFDRANQIEKSEFLQAILGTKTTFNIEQCEIKEDEIILSGWIMPVSQTRSKQNPTIYFSANQKFYKKASIMQIRKDVSKHFNVGDLYDYSGFSIKFKFNERIDDNKFYIVLDDQGTNLVVEKNCQ